MIDLYNGDCLDVMDKLIEKGVVVDAIITDPPYGTTACKWDNVIPFDAMWERLNKLIKTNGAIVLFGSEPFSSALRMSNIEKYKYDWIWKKSLAANFMNAKNCPMKKHELIHIFSDGTMANGSRNKMPYSPQGIEEVNQKWKRPNTINSEHGYQRPSHKLERTITHTGYPDSILDFPSGNNKTVHPTQKPTPLMEYLIKTYTNENETVLDFTMGSGTTGVAAQTLNRKFIGIELDEKYFKIAEDRIYDRGSLFEVSNG